MVNYDEPNPVDIYMHVTGVCSDVAVRVLQHHRGDLNEALDVYYGVKDRPSISLQSSFDAPQDDYFDMYDPLSTEMPPLPPLTSSPFADFGPLSFLDDPNFARRAINSTTVTASQLTTIKDTTGTEDEIFTIEDEDDGFSNAAYSGSFDGESDTDEQMMRAAIEASLQDIANLKKPPSNLTVEQEKNPLGLKEEVGASALEAQNSVAPDKMNSSLSDGRHSRLEVESLSSSDEGEDIEDLPLSSSKRQRHVSEASSPQKPYSVPHSQQNAIDFPSDEEMEKQLAEKEASLPEEPDVDDENAVKLLVQLPDGRKTGRRFLKSDKLQYLFDFIDVSGEVEPGKYLLVWAYPRHSFSDIHCNSTLAELGLVRKQEALYLEYLQYMDI